MRASRSRGTLAGTVAIAGASSSTGKICAGRGDGMGGGGGGDNGVVISMSAGSVISISMTGLVISSSAIGSDSGESGAIMRGGDGGGMVGVGVGRVCLATVKPRSSSWSSMYIGAGVGWFEVLDEGTFNGAWGCVESSEVLLSNLDSLRNSGAGGSSTSKAAYTRGTIAARLSSKVDASALVLETILTRTTVSCRNAVLGIAKQNAL